MHREPRVLETEVQVGKWLDFRARITSKELAQLHSVKNGIPWSACSTSPTMDANWEISALTHTARLTNSQARSFSKNGDKIAVATLKTTRQLGCVFSGYGATKVFIDFAEELKHTEANLMCSIHHSRVTSRQHSRPKTIAWNNWPR